MPVEINTNPWKKSKNSRDSLRETKYSTREKKNSAREKKSVREKNRKCVHEKHFPPVKNSKNPKKKVFTGIFFFHGKKNLL